jgi:hypothetical protein
LVFADWKWQILDQLALKEFFTLQEEKTISAIADTIILEGLLPILPNPGSNPVEMWNWGIVEVWNW